MSEAEREGLLEDLDTEKNARLRAHMEDDLEHFNRVLEITERLIEKTGH